VTENSSQAPLTLKLAMVLFRYFPWGGMQANFLRIVKASLARGHQVDVYTLDWQGEQPEALNVNIVEVVGRRNTVRYTYFAARVERLTGAKKYDLVMGFNRMPGLDLYYAADPCFVERIRKTRPWYYPFTARYRHFQTVEKNLFGPQSKTQILALSQLQIDEYTRNYATQRGRFRLLAPGVPAHYRRHENAAKFRNIFRERHDIAEDDWVLLMIGSGFERKGMDRGLRAVAELSSDLKVLCHLFVVGKGREKPLRRLAKRLGLNSGLNFVPGSSEIPLYLQGADLLIHPARSENTGNVIVEAIAAGLPVLCSGTCGYASHVQSAQAGSVIDEPFAQENLNRQLVEMLDRKKLQAWQNNALEYAEHEDLYSRTVQAIEAIETLALDRQKNA
jgi:UDP-glucose:(heptosyl)LPS alpha-1,3-glucosyltransferase